MGRTYFRKAKDFHRTVEPPKNPRLAGALCDSCPLRNSKPVWGDGDVERTMAIVGEAPGREEVEVGVPFIGKSGQYVENVLSVHQMTRNEVWLDNAVLCVAGLSIVRLGDGSTQQIASLVKAKYRGEVQCVDEAGHIVTAKVTNTFRSPRKKRKLVKLTTENSRAVRVGEVGPILTADHEVLALDALGRPRWFPVGKMDGRMVATGARAFKDDDLIGAILLGDGTLKKSRLVWTHVERNADWTEAKARLLSGLETNTATVTAASGLQRRAATRASRYLARMEKKWYPKGRKVVPTDFHLTPRALAFWFMDDGHTAFPKGRQPRIEFATCGFDRKSCDRLVDGLKQLGLRAWVLKVGKYNRVKVASEHTGMLHRLIAPWVVPSMQYKLMPEWRGFYDASLFRPAEVVTDYDKARVHEVMPRRQDKWVYCLEVEKHHNFLLSNVVAHNCFPDGGDMKAFLQRAKKTHDAAQAKLPANKQAAFKSPIDCCRPRLFRWLGIPRCTTCGLWAKVPKGPLRCTCLKTKRKWVTVAGVVQPKVILTLGNSALEALTGHGGIKAKQLYTLGGED